jgi:stearoyl-CoA desaturase (delta-9 desaturase)
MLHDVLLGVLVSLFVTQATVFATTIFLHRTATHKALILHPIVVWFFKLILWLTSGIRTAEWVAVHLKHHAHTDEEGDPHSPGLLGFWSVQLGNVFHYLKAKKEPGILERYRCHIKEGAWDRFLFNHGLLGLAIGIGFACLLLGVVAGLALSVVHAVMYIFILSSSINGLCHWLGYKNFPNTATNVRLLALLTGGEGLHNNHHGYPRSPKFSWNKRWSEIDPAWPVIKFLEFLRLAKPQRTMDEAAA